MAHDHLEKMSVLGRYRLAGENIVDEEQPEAVLGCRDRADAEILETESGGDAPVRLGCEIVLLHETHLVHPPDDDAVEIVDGNRELARRLREGAVAEGMELLPLVHELVERQVLVLLEDAPDAVGLLGRGGPERVLAAQQVELLTAQEHEGAVEAEPLLRRDDGEDGEQDILFLVEMGDDLAHLAEEIHELAPPDHLHVEILDLLRVHRGAHEGVLERLEKRDVDPAPALHPLLELFEERTFEAALDELFLEARKDPVPAPMSRDLPARRALLSEGGAIVLVAGKKFPAVIDLVAVLAFRHGRHPAKTVTQGRGARKAVISPAAARRPRGESSLPPPGTARGRYRR